MLCTDNLARICLISCLVFLLGGHSRVECKAIFGIGMRIAGDQLLLKDVLQARATGIAQSPKIEFNYAIPEPITYIEILAEENVLAKVHFSYQHDLVQGTVAAINATTTLPFEVLITVYGFNETILNVHPAYTLNKDQHFEGILEPQQNAEKNEEDADDANEYLTGSEEYLETFDSVHENNIDEEEAIEDFEHRDKIIEVGQRQDGDYLIYETYQTSLKVSEQPTNHTVVFYYVDSDLITYVRFVVFDHFTDKPTTGADYRPPLAEYTHFSPTTLKATITEHNATNLFVQMFLYGYKPTDLPFGYVPFLRQTRLPASTDTGASAAPMSPLQRLKLLMNAQQRTSTTEAAPALAPSVQSHSIAEDPMEGAASEEKQAQIGANSVMCLDNVAVAVPSRAGAASMSADLLIPTALGADATTTATDITFWVAVISVLFCLLGRRQL